MRTHHAAWLRHQARLRAQDAARMLAKARFILNHPDMEYFGLTRLGATGIGLREAGAEISRGGLEAGAGGVGVAVLSSSNPAVLFGVATLGGIVGSVTSAAGCVIQAFGDPNYGGKDAGADITYHMLSGLVGGVSAGVADDIASVALSAPFWIGDVLGAP